MKGKSEKSHNEKVIAQCFQQGGILLAGKPAQKPKEVVVPDLAQKLAKLNRVLSRRVCRGK